MFKLETQFTSLIIYKDYIISEGWYRAVILNRYYIIHNLSIIFYVQTNKTIRALINFWFLFIPNDTIIISFNFHH